MGGGGGVFMGVIAPVQDLSRERGKGVTVYPPGPTASRVNRVLNYGDGECDSKLVYFLEVATEGCRTQQ